jgi:hypothetical protein
MVLESQIEKSVREHNGLSYREWVSLMHEEKERLISEYLQSPDYMKIAIRKSADTINGLRQDKEHLEMEIDMLKVNLENLCDELTSYRELWFVKLYIWIKRIDVPNCKELMSGRW